MNDIVFSKLIKILIIFILVYFGFLMKNSSNKMTTDKVYQMSGTLISEADYWENDNSHYIDFKIESFDRKLTITNHAFDAVKINYGFRRFMEIMKIGSNLKLGVNKEDYFKDKGSVDVIFIEVGGVQIINFEDYMEEYDKSVAWSHKYYWVPFAIALFLFLMVVFQIELKGKDELLIPEGVRMIDLNKIKDFELGEYKCRFDNDRHILTIDNEIRTLIKIDFIKRIFIYKPFIFEIYTRFEDIDKFGVKKDDNGETDIYLRNKKGIEFSILNTKSNGIWFLDGNRKIKEKMEIIFLSIFYSIRNYAP